MVSSDPPKHNLALTFAIWLGSFALLATTLLVVISVLGRHLQIPLPGSVEMVEALIVLVASSSLLLATFDKAHAAARLFVEKMSPVTQQAVEKFGLLMGAIFIVALLIGSVWLIIEYWYAHEATHLLGIPIAPLRWLFCASLLLITILLLVRLLSSSTKNSEHL